jgi:predicted NBD/HSP70 family sugar kinase
VRRAFSEPARHRHLREANLGLLMRELAESGRMSRARLAARTGLTKATVSSLVEQLAAVGLVVELAPEGTGGSGRPGAPVTLNERGPVGLGLEIGVDYTAICVVDLTGAVRHRVVVPASNRDSVPREAIARARAAASDVLAALAEAGQPIAGMGVAVPGPVNEDSGVLTQAPNIGWKEVPVRALVSAAFGVDRVELGNEVSYAALAELWYGAANGLEHFIQVSGEIGVGAGIVLDGALFRGAHGFAGELGHVCVEPSGPTCLCGARGCLEAIAGQRALLSAIGADPRHGTRLGDPGGAATLLVERATAGDVATLRALSAAGRALGIGLASLINVVDVETVVLGGFFAALADWLLEPLAAELAARVVTKATVPPRVLLSSLGPDAAVRGAAGSVVRRIIATPGIAAG